MKYNSYRCCHANSSGGTAAELGPNFFAAASGIFKTLFETPIRDKLFCE